MTENFRNNQSILRRFNIGAELWIFRRNVSRSMGWCGGLARNFESEVSLRFAASMVVSAFAPGCASWAVFCCMMSMSISMPCKRLTLAQNVSTFAFSELSKGPFSCYVVRNSFMGIGIEHTSSLKMIRVSPTAPTAETYRRLAMRRQGKTCATSLFIRESRLASCLCLRSHDAPIVLL